MELITVAQGLLRRWWLVAALGAVGLAIAYFISVTASERYQSVVTLQLNPAARSALLPYSSDGSATDPVNGLASSYAELLRSRAFGELVVKQLNLVIPPEAVAASINATLVPNTNIFRITVTLGNPTDAQGLAQAVAEIFVSETLRRQEVQSRIADMETTAASYPARIEAIRVQRDRLDQAVNRGDLSRLNELNNLETRLAGLEASYANLLVEINRTRSSMNTASILDNATPGASTRVSPLSRDLLYGLATGLGLAISLVILLELLDNTIRGPEDVEAISGTAPLAMVGRFRSRNRKRSSQPPPLVALNEVHAPSAEMLGVIRANICFAASGGHCKSFIITSAGHGEGKTFMACNLAVTFAQSGDRVLLVDADLRRPGVHEAFHVDNDQGYIDALASVGRAADVEGLSDSGKPSSEQSVGMVRHSVQGIVPSSLENLSLLVSGPLPPYPPAVLGSEANTRLIEQLGKLWDIVIFDTTPVIPFADTRLLSASADAILVIARAGVTRRAALADCLKALSQAGSPILGVVLNDFEPVRSPAIIRKVARLLSAKRR
jgi:Mrp family chromosome partitioning ATPase/capsular polysaccharide biosynthesis protein